MSLFEDLPSISYGEDEDEAPTNSVTNVLSPRRQAEKDERDENFRRAGGVDVAKNLNYNNDKKPKWYRKKMAQITGKQKETIRRLFPKYGINLERYSPVEYRFDDDAGGGGGGDFVLEIGSGLGDVISQVSQRDPSKKFIATEIHRASTAHLLSKLDAGGRPDNVRLVGGDAVKYLSHHVPSGFFGEMWILFPDPWENDNERKVVCPSVVDLLRDRMADGGRLYIATDVEKYAVRVEEVMKGRKGWEGGRLEGRPEWRPVSKYEKRGIEELNHDIFDFAYTKVAATSDSNNVTTSSSLSEDSKKSTIDPPSTSRPCWRSGLGELLASAPRTMKPPSTMDSGALREMEILEEMGEGYKDQFSKKSGYEKPSSYRRDDDDDDDDER